ncbi:hypothetical protein BU16DRAFT_529426 [Lophium mytilinum]|uniref:Peroxin-22-like protein Pex22-like-Penicillium chrysogenum n=1 Tax=Lophium mytilinum TaxID=390894 RepID=A0A6A6QJ59_9PEZI|nr:hypothetical protein BU16DRAFT_529426 [Lophium mytilinum]
MSFSYDRYDRRQSSSRRTTFGYWVPLVFTVTVATAGVAAWIWSQREEDEDESDDADLSYGEDGDRAHPIPGPRDVAGSASQGVAHEEEGFLGRVQGAIRRTPSPQQAFDLVSKKAVAGVAAAGAAVGGVLSSIREEDKDAFDESSRWSEEQLIRRSVEAQSSQSASAVATHTSSFGASVRGGPQSTGVRRKTVVIVVSAEATLENMHEEEEQGAYHTEHASILSHIPEIDASKARVFVLIYSPSLTSQRTGSSGSYAAPPSLGSSYSALSTPAVTPGEELTQIAPHPESPYTPAQTATTPALSARDSDHSLWNSLHVQALRLVENPSMVMPFTTPTGHVHMLRHLAPDVVYIVDALSGDNGANVEQVKSWVGQVIVVVGADGAGLGGLVDTDDEGTGGEGRAYSRGHKWWESAEMVGLGKGVEVVDGARIREDVEKRVGDRD